MPSLGTLWSSIGADVTAYFRAAPRATIRTAANAWLALSGTASPDLNYLVISGGDDGAGQLREYVGIVQSSGCPVIALLPSSIADTLAPIAQELGLMHVGSAPIMVWEPNDALLDRRSDDRMLTVDPVADGVALGDANAVLSDAFGIPRACVDEAINPGTVATGEVTIFLTRQDGRAVGTVTTIQRGNLVGIYSMGTIAAAQRNGIGRETLLRATAYAWERGGRVFYLGATPPGKPLYDRLGFRTVDDAALWVAGESSQFVSH
jgi:GNAT superfamily N-acetyltransferase